MINNPKKISIEKYVKSKRLMSEPLKMSKSDIILLPNNKILHEYRDNENQFTSITKDILLTLKDNEINASLYDDGKEIREIILRSAHPDIIFPILIFTDKILIPIVLGILGTWIYDKFIKNNSQDTLKMEYGYADLQNDTIETFKLEGSAEQVQKLIKNEIDNFDNKSNDYMNNSSDSKFDNDPWKDICDASAQKSMASANKLIEEAKECVYKNNMKEAESLLRKSLVKIREAFLWTEDKKYQDKLYIIGRKLHDIFGCQLEFSNGQYNQTCPVFLSHSTMGFSIGGSSITICSICGENTLKCPHINMKTYNNVLAQDLTDVCNICGKKDCDHEIGNFYDNVEAFSIISDINFDHVSLVKKPADPLCAIMSHEVPKSEILKELNENERDNFVFGETKINCDHCILNRS